MEGVLVAIQGVLRAEEVAAGFDLGAGSGEQLARATVQHADPHALEDVERGLVHRFHLIGAQ